MDAMPSPGKPARTSSAELDWRVEITGDLVEVKAAFLHPPRGLPKRRGICKGFTRGSRLRMFKMVSRVDWSNIKTGLFLTLTYPDEVAFPDRVARGRHLYVFLRSLENILGAQFGALWRVEWLPRQTGVNRGKVYPHFHLIIPGIRYINWMTIRAAWGRAIGHRGKLVTHVQRLSDSTMHRVYIAKYCAKLPELSSLVHGTYSNIDGRHWGVHRRNLVPMHKKVVYDGLSEACVNELQTIGREKFAWYGEYAELGFSMFGKLGAEMREAVRQLCLDY